MVGSRTFVKVLIFSLSFVSFTVLPREAERQRADARSELVAHQVVAAQRSAALRTLREPEMSIAAGRTPGGGSYGHRRRPARALAAHVSAAAAAGRADAAGGGPRSRSSAPGGSTDAPRDGDIRSRRDRPQRPSYWAVEAFCARSCMPHMLERAESSAQSTSYGRSRASATDLDVL